MEEWKESPIRAARVASDKRRPKEVRMAAAQVAMRDEDAKLLYVRRLIMAYWLQLRDKIAESE